MYVLVVSFSKSPEFVTPHVETHSMWVKKYIDKGIFLAAGPKKSKLGGVILAKNIDKENLKKILEEDSYVQNDVVDYQIIDMNFRLSSDEFKFLIDEK